MNRIYSTDEMKRILHEIGIEPINGKINSQGVAKIWNWRLRQAGEDKEYTDKHVRAHVRTRSLVPTDKIHNRLNLFEIKDAFHTRLEPQKTNRGGRKKQFSKIPQNS